MFGGGASVLLAKKPSRVEVYNDIDGDLVNLFRVLRDKHEEFNQMWRYVLVSREEFDRFWDMDPEKMEPLQRAFRYLYLNRTGFGGHMLRPALSVKATAPNNLSVWAEQADEHITSLHERVRRVYIDNMNFRKLIPYYDGLKCDGDTVFYLDPPYLVKDPAYVHWFELQDHLDLLECVKNIKGKWLMTINDCPEYRQWYADYYIAEKSKQYSLAKEDSGRHEFGELIISNYPLPEQKQARLF